MKNNVTFSTANYDYLYSCNHKECIPLYPILRRIIKLDEDGCLGSVPNDPELNGYSPEMIAYYLRKYDYLKARGIIASKDNVEFASLTASCIQEELENLSVLTFEVTDRCNLRCRYCAYGDLYEGYDERKGQDMDFGVAQKMLEYLYSIWENANPLSSVRTVAIGFYGGEPLMNFELIRQVVEYTSKHPLSGIVFKYNMTTNAMLLNKYQDFLQKHDFKLLISLDGTKEDDCHRITTNGKPSFEHVYRQVKVLKQTYPDYFQHSVVFNSVIHSKSNIERILDFFEKEFGRQTMFSELSNKSVVNKEVYDSMYRSVIGSIALSARQRELDEKLMYGSPTISSLTYYLHHLSNEVFKDYRTMFYGVKKLSLLPTGSCIPFSRKLFVTVTGKILACEHISHEFALGRVSEQGVKLNLEEIAQKYNEQYYSKITPVCKKCYMQKCCAQCMFYTGIQEQKVVCRNYKNYDSFAKYLATNLNYMEQNPWAYDRVMKEISLY